MLLLFGFFFRDLAKQSQKEEEQQKEIDF